MVKPKPAPKEFRVKLGRHHAHFTRKKVVGAKSYCLDIIPVHFIGPRVLRTIKTKKHALNVDYDRYLHVRNEQQYQFVVSANNSRAAMTKTHFTTADLLLRGHVTVDAERRTDATSLVNRCIQNGGAMALSTVAGGGVLLLAAVWIPGLGEVPLAPSSLMQHSLD